ncbi:unnamed protein product [Caenorhabditis auriculariae]|uniref:Cystatin domain-containing protein n=1 Tax=Caenorhabditis auriculariae TaxID=2777116 RepID=A0A8S1H128_9PELO|nr:unnamed protein product [Caenorhabditis auriculariae]
MLSVHWKKSGKMWRFISLISLASCQISFHFDTDRRHSIFPRDSLLLPPLRSQDDGVLSGRLIPLTDKFMVNRPSVAVEESPVSKLDLTPPPTTSTTTPEPTTTTSIPPSEAQFLQPSDPNEEEEAFREGPLDLTSKLAVRLAWKAFEEDVNERVEEEFMWVPLKVLNGNGQIVSGMLYDLSVLAGVSNCSRYEVSTYSLRDYHCVYRQGKPRGIFNVLVSEKSNQWSQFIPDSSRVYSLLERRVAEDEFIA